MQKNAVFFFFFKLTRILYLGLFHWLSPHLKTIWQVWFCFPPSFVKYYSVICQDYLYLKLYHHYNSLLYSCVIITFVALLTSNRFSVTKLFFFLCFFVFFNEFFPSAPSKWPSSSLEALLLFVCFTTKTAKKKSGKVMFYWTLLTNPWNSFVLVKALCCLLLRLLINFPAFLSIQAFYNLSVACWNFVLFVRLPG